MNPLIFASIRQYAGIDEAIFIFWGWIVDIISITILQLVYPGLAKSKPCQLEIWIPVRILK